MVKQVRSELLKHFLSITNDIIKAHVGSLNLSSKEGEGTIFTIELPGNKKNS